MTMAGKGGYQPPAKPAAVSGPGKHSQRTDGGPADQARQAHQYLSGDNYGDSKELNAVNNAAPLAAAPGIPSGGPIPQGQPLPEQPEVTPFGASTERPDEPVTHGNPLGPGAGPEALQLPNNQPDSDRSSALIRAMYEIAPSPELARIVDLLNRQGK